MDLISRVTNGSDLNVNYFSSLVSGTSFTDVIHAVHVYSALHISASLEMQWSSTVQGNVYICVVLHGQTTAQTATVLQGVIAYTESDNAL